MLGIPCRILVDGAAGALLASGCIRAVLVGADRIASNGDVANKIGTYPLAVLSARHRIPFYVLAPSSTLDPSLADGSAIVIEERDPAEVLRPAAAPGAAAYNPAFDVTPADLISGIVTDFAVYRRPYQFGPVSDSGMPGEAYARA
jgi:methylthioribose-1-phosphate isomerase